MPSRRHLSAVKVYKPIPRFVPISVTGQACSLNCAHCRRHYLRHMINPRPFGGLEALVDYLVEKQNIIGILVSGGMDRSLKVPIDWNIIRKIKKKYDLKINVHVGFIEKDDIEKIAFSEVDVVSLDFVLSDEAIWKVYGIHKTREDYLHIIDLLESYGIKYAPHITVGLNWGKIGWEYDAIDALRNRSFEVLVINVLIPTRGTPMERVALDINAVKSVFKYAREKISDKELSLGCMRPRILEYEKFAIDIGFERVVLPQKRSVDYIKSKGMKIIEKNTCCVFS